MNNEKRWYAIYTKPRWEKKVADLLSKKSIENYCPLNKVTRQWSDRKKTVYEPLFSSYVFIHASEAEHTLIKQTDGILNFVYWLNKPAIIKNEEIENIKEFLKEYETVQLEKSIVNVNETIRIINGPLVNREGNVVEVKNKTVKVILPSLGYSLIAIVSKSNIEKVAFIEKSKTFSSLTRATNYFQS